MKKSNRKPRLSWEVVLVSATICIFSFIQMRNYVLTFWPIGHSDLVGFYVTRFPDGGHYWPYDAYQVPGKDGLVQPIEYPVLIGVVVWLTSLITPLSTYGRFYYFYINVALIAALFVYSSHLIYRHLGKRFVRYYLLSPVLLFSLYLNWDLWVVVPLILALTLFEEQRYSLSAFWLGVAIAVKFFPAVLLLPISIYFYRTKSLRALINYFGVSVGTWILINLPVVLKSPDGWLYFYKFSATRILGDGSFYNLFSKFGFKFQFPMAGYYLLNLVTFIILIVYLIKSKKNLSLIESAFFAVAAFTLFGKQYSMQYILWLLPLAVLAIAKVPKFRIPHILKYFIFWQAAELFFNYAYFKNMLKEISDFQYAIFGTLRYVTFVMFVYLLAKLLANPQDLKVKTR